MPRVNFVKAARPSDKNRTCTNCGEPILVGQSFFWWGFRYGGRRYQHSEHGSPRQSQLTQSLMADVYAAQEEITDLGEDAEWEAKAEAVQALAETAREVASQYEQAAEAFNGAGENQERYEMLEQWADELDEAAEKLNAVVEVLAEAEGALEVAASCPL